MTGRSVPDGLSSQATEPGCTVSAVPASIPSAELDELEVLLSFSTPLPWARANLAHVTTRHVVRSDGVTESTIRYCRGDDVLAARAVNVLPTLIAIARRAIATEAGTAETVKQGSVHEGAGPKDIAQ